MSHKTIYMLTINHVAATPDTIVSSFRAQRTERKVEYYESRTGANTRRDEIYEGMKKLVGFIENVEVEIKEVQVRP